MFRSFKDMPVWQDAMAIAVDVFRLTEQLPRKEDYGFTSQIRRSALSISANLAEGFGRGHPREKVKFYLIGRGSASETQSHLEYGMRVGYFLAQDADRFYKRLNSVVHDINKLISMLQRQLPSVEKR
jgi:four helix bundle protein